MIWIYLPSRGILSLITSLDFHKKKGRKATFYPTHSRTQHKVHCLLWKQERRKERNERKGEEGSFASLEWGTPTCVYLVTRYSNFAFSAATHSDSHEGEKKRRRRVFFKSFLRLGWWVSFSTAVSPARQSLPRQSKRWTMEMTIRLSHILLLVPGRLIAHPIPYFCWFTAPLVSYIYVIVQLFSDRMTTRGKTSSWICQRLGHDRKYNKDKRNWPIDTRDHPEETPDIMWFRSTRIWMPRNGWKCCWPV